MLRIEHRRLGAADAEDLRIEQVGVRQDRRSGNVIGIVVELSGNAARLQLVGVEPAHRLHLLADVLPELVRRPGARGADGHADDRDQINIAAGHHYSPEV